MVTKEWGSRRKVTRDSHAVLQGHRGKDGQPGSHHHIPTWNYGCGTQPTQAGVSAGRISNCVTSGKLFNHSVPWFLHPYHLGRCV